MSTRRQLEELGDLVASGDHVLLFRSYCDIGVTGITSAWENPNRTMQLSAL